MEILILGAGGMAGHLATIYLREKGHQVTGFSKTTLSFCETIIGDALNKDDINKALHYKQYDAVINCIGVLNKDVDHKLSDGIFLNSYLPHFITDSLKDTQTKLIHLSTDCVFSGRNGGYSENSFKDSDTFYGMTKSLGEVKDNKNLTIRTSIIGPDRKVNGVGLLNWFLKQKDSVNGYTTAIWTGVTTIVLARAIEQALEENLCGLYHLVNNQTISKYELLLLFNQYIKKEPVEINPDDTVHVDKSLLNNRVDFNFTVPSYIEMVKEMDLWIESHKELYLHYEKV